MSNFVSEALNGEKIVKAYHMEKYELANFDLISEKYHKENRKLNFIFGKYWTYTYTIVLVLNLITIFLSIFELENNLLTIGELFVFISYSMMMMYPIRNLGKNLAEAGKMKVSIRRIEEFLSLETEDYQKGSEFAFEHDIEFKDVSFGYSDNKNIINNLSFKLNKGKSLAIFGKIGAGKSTIAYLLTGMLKQSSGSILIDGINIDEINKASLRKNISLILQDSFLFSKTIKENVKIVNQDISDEQTNEVLKIAMIKDAIDEFKDGINTIVGEHGITLSGGQKQRIAISRSLIKDSSILIFDDSFSALDNKTELSIRNNLKEINNKTMIIITQRINIAKDCDQVLVLENNFDIKIGTHDELIDKLGLYQNIYKLQSVMSLDE